MTRLPRRVLGAASVLAACLAVVPAAHAQFRITSFSTSLTDPGTSTSPRTTDQLAAGAHPDLTVTLRFPYKNDDQGNPVSDGDVRQIHVDLPAGLVVDPGATPKCDQQLLVANASGLPQCQPDTQIGEVGVSQPSLPDQAADTVPLYNMEKPQGGPAEFGFLYLGRQVKLVGRLGPDGGYHLLADVGNVAQGIAIQGAEVHFWGTPSDPVHDARRFDPARGIGQPTPSTAPRNALVSNPTTCSSEPVRFSASASSWQDTDHPVTARDADEPDGTPYRFTGCGSLPFAPSARVAPTTTAPDAPTGLDFSLTVPQTRSPDVRAAAHLRDLELTLPEGMAINPSVASGLQACTSAQIGLGTDSDVTCPSASRLGSVSIATPLVDAPLTGDVYLAEQGDNPFGTLLGLYLVAKGPNVLLKLGGRIDLDPATGRLVTTFADNPQLPFTQLDVRLDGGDRAPLTTPPTCGPQSARTEMTAWSGAKVIADSAFTIDCTAGLGAFAPGFSAGTSQPVAGQASPLVLDVTRPDGQAPVSGVSLTLPAGLLAKLRGIPRCSDQQAGGGACDYASQVGTATILAGAGTQPFSLPGTVSLTGPYKGAPYGLAVRVRVLAGPLDLGTVVVRQALFIDPDDTHVTVVSDPLPTILSGIPVRLRRLNVSIDRPDFVVNPTSCAPKSIGGTLGSPDGRAAAESVAFQVGGCGDLKLTPKLALTLRGLATGLRDGGHPALQAVLTQPGGQSNLRRAKVTLPLSLALDPNNAQALCETADAAKPIPSCPASSIVGTATATTPLLDSVLKGPVYFVKGQRTDAKTGRIIKTLPTLVVPLSGDGVQITLRATTAVAYDKLVTTFDRIPDAPVSRFELNLAGGKHGILVTNKSICRRSRALQTVIDGQNGASTTSAATLGAKCKATKKSGRR